MAGPSDASTCKAFSARKTAARTKASNGSNSVISAQQIGNVDGHGPGRAVGLARHAIPAFVIFHVRLAGEVTYPEHVEGAYIDADGASLVGDAFGLVDNDRDGCGGVGDRHEVSVSQACWRMRWRS